MSQQLLNIDPRYLKHPQEAISFSSSLTAPLVISFKLKLHFMYSALLRLNLNYRDSNSCLQHSNLAFTPSWSALPKECHQQTTCTKAHLLVSIELSPLGLPQKENGLGTSLEGQLWLGNPLLTPPHFPNIRLSISIHILHNINVFN